MTIPYATAANQVPVSSGQGTIYTAQTIPDLSTIVTLDGVQTLTNKTLTAPVIDAIAGPSGDTIAQFTGASGGVNSLNITVGTPGINVSLSPVGEANTGLDIIVNGTGDLNLVSAGGNVVSTSATGGGAPALGFFNTAPVVKPTGVAVTAGAIHAALVSLGLIAP